jgi:hypothetical protein
MSAMSTTTLRSSYGARNGSVPPERNAPNKYLAE